MRRRALKLTSHAILTCVLALLMASVSAPASGSDARHYMFFNPNPGFFGLWNGLTETNGGGVRKLTLARTVLWRYDLGSGAEPRSAYRTSGGDTVVADAAGSRVLVITPGGSVGWRYDSGDNSKLEAPAGVAPGAEAGSVLIADPTGRQVLDVSVDKSVRWHYRASDHPDLERPTSARMVPGTDHVLITDPTAGRVIEVAQGGSTTWSSSAAAKPRDARRVSSDRTLITDEDGHRVIMVDGSGAVRWHFGVEGESGSDTHHLDSPTSADYHPADGSVLIADTGNNRVLRVSSGGTVTDVYGNGGASDSNASIDPMGGVSRTDAGTTLIVDTAGHRLLEVGYASAGTFDTTALDLGMQGVDKWMTDILPDTTHPKGTSVRVSYSQDGGAWLAAGHGGAFTIADSAPAKSVRFHVVFTTADPGVSPTMKRLDAKFYLQKPAKWDPKKGKGSGGGSGSKSTTSTATTNSGSGSGSGTGGSGSGSGSGGSGGSGSGGGAKSSSPAAGGKTSIGGGIAGGTGPGTGGAGVKFSNTVSGMVMSEVSEDAGGASSATGPGAYGNGAPNGNELVPSAAMMLVAYTLGLAWTSATRWASRFARFRLAG